MPREGRAGHKQTGGVRSAAEQQRTRTRNVQVTWQRVAHIHTHCALSECDTLSSCPNRSHPTSVSPRPSEHYHTFGELELSSNLMKGLVSVDLPTRSHDYPTRSHIAKAIPHAQGREGGSQTNRRRAKDMAKDSTGSPTRSAHGDGDGFGDAHTSRAAAFLGCCACLACADGRRWLSKKILGQLCCCWCIFSSWRSVAHSADFFTWCPS